MSPRFRLPAARGWAEEGKAARGRTGKTLPGPEGQTGKVSLKEGRNLPLFSGFQLKSLGEHIGGSHRIFAREAGIAIGGLFRVAAIGLTDRAVEPV